MLRTVVAGGKWLHPGFFPPVTYCGFSSSAKHLPAGAGGGSGSAGPGHTTCWSGHPVEGQPFAESLTDCV